MSSSPLPDLGRRSVLLGALGLVVGVVSAGDGEAPGTVDLVAAALARVPAVAVMVAVALLAAAAAPSRAPALGWGALALAFGLGEVGTVVGLPAWIVDVSPFGHVPPLPGGEFEPVPAIVLLAVAAALTGLAHTAYGRRDVA